MIEVCFIKFKKKKRMKFSQYQKLEKKQDKGSVEELFLGKASLHK